MEKKKSILKGFSLIEMLLVLAIIIILSSMGIGGFIGFRETALARENVETLKQDILLAQHKSMLLERGVDDSWVYGIGIDFSEIGETHMGNPYRYFKWCSPFPNFGNTVTRSKIPGWDPIYPIGNTLNVGDVLGRATNPIIITPIDPISTDDDDGGNYIEPIPIDYDDDDYVPLEPEVPFDPEDVYEEEELPPGTFANGILPVLSPWTSSCVPGQTSLVEITGQYADKLIDIGAVYLLSDRGDESENIKIHYVVFEALTGRAFIYDEAGYPISYNTDGSYRSDSSPLDIVLERNRSSKFDLITIYPRSGVVIHHVYSNDDVVNQASDDTFLLGSKIYKRYGIFDEIDSYRD